MAKLYCKYFPGTPATWTCTACQTCFGDQCIPAGHSKHLGKRPPRCLLCDGNLRYLGNATDAKPFWQQVPHFFSYASHNKCLVLIALTAGLSLLFSAGLIAIFMLLLTMAIVMKFSFAIIEKRGKGDAEPPALSDVISGDEHHLFLRQMAVFLGMGAMVYAAAQVGEWLAVMVSIFLAFAMPASTIVLAVDKSVRRALNPVILLSVMTAIGLPYLLLWVCTQIISAGPSYILPWLSDFLPEPIFVPVLTAVVVYFVLVLYTMLGYVLYQYQQELGYVTSAAESDMDTPTFEKAKAVGEVTVFIQEGQLDRARQVLRAALDSMKDDIDLHLLYHKLLLAQGDNETLASHCQYFVDLCVNRKAVQHAVPVLLNVIKRVEGFRLAKSASALEIARRLAAQGQHRPLVSLLKDWHLRSPDDPIIPEAYALMVRSLLEYYGDDQAARAAAHYVLTHFPNNKFRPELERLLSVMDGSAGKGKTEPAAQARHPVKRPDST